MAYAVVWGKLRNSLNVVTLAEAKHVGNVLVSRGVTKTADIYQMSARGNRLVGRMMMGGSMMRRKRRR